MVKLFAFINKNKYIIFIIVISLIYLTPLLQKGFFLSHDGESQIIRMAARYKAVLDGQFPVRWAGDLNYGYGSPAYIFYYQLSGYLGVIVHSLGFSFESGYKLLLGTSFMLSPIFFFIWLRQIFKENIAFVSSVIYALDPYGFLDVYVRGHIGESLALALIPLTLYFIQKNKKQIKNINIFLGSISFALLINAHGILSMIFTPVIFLYSILLGLKEKKIIFANMMIIFFGFLLSAYFWIPAMLEGKYINSRIFVSDWYKDHFLNINNIIYSAWGFGPDVNKPGGLSAQIGPFNVALSVLSILLINKIKEKRYVLFWLFFFFVSIFMSMPVSDFFWSKFHILQQFQFPWRFTALSSFACIVLSAYVFKSLNSRKILALSLLVVVILSIPMTKINIIDSKPDLYYLNNPSTASFHNEATTIWTAGDAYKFPKSPIEVVSGVAGVSEYLKKSNLHTFKINAITDVTILDNTVYFPGWRVEVDGKKVPIQFQDENYRGLITFKVNKGIHSVKVFFTESPIRFFSDSISILGFVLLILILFRDKLKFILKRK